MFVLSNFIIAVARIVDITLTIAYWLVIVRALISWVNPDPFNPIVKFLHAATEPLLYPIRKFLPFTLRLGIDISPVIAILAIIFLKSFLVRTLIDISVRLQ